MKILLSLFHDTPIKH